MLIIEQVKAPVGTKTPEIMNKIAKLIRVNVCDMSGFCIRKKSIDARKKPQLFEVIAASFSCPNEENVLKRNPKLQLSKYQEKNYRFPFEDENCKLKDRPVVIGFGPAGMFCAYFLAKSGCRPIVLERGKCVEERTKDVSLFWETGTLNSESNVQFGEGGAGTFSDGKLNTLVKDKDGKQKRILEIFHSLGAPKEILYDAKPHIGTDVLCEVVKRMREEILSLGGEIRFESRVDEFYFEGNYLKGVRLKNNEMIPCSEAILAIGHSARDTFHVLNSSNVLMEPKAFAVGLRVQHPQRKIDFSQYGMDHLDMNGLPPSPYKLVMQSKSGRGVYSFCMCPGGYVVNASSEEKRLAVNGMSYSGRDSENANSAIVVNVTPNDFEGDGPLCGVSFQQKLEEKAFMLGNGKIPCSYYGDFKKRVNHFTPSVDEIKEEPSNCIKGEFCFADISTLFPQEIAESFVEGMEYFGTKIKGFNDPDTILCGVESRTSSPVRIVRDEESLQALNHCGLFPCGEGAGYAGGIMSAALDGIRVAEAVIKGGMKE